MKLSNESNFNNPDATKVEKQTGIRYPTMLNSKPWKNLHNINSPENYKRKLKTQRVWRHFKLPRGACPIIDNPR